MSTNERMSPRASWLFVLGSAGVGVGASYALAGAGVVASAGAYFLIVLVGALLATRKTLATAGGTIGRMLLAGIIASVAYFLLIRHAAHVAASSLTDVDHASAEAAGSVVGGLFGTVVAVAIFVETMVAGTIGALIGGRGR
jgi:hypothetical protein